jgi:EPS-associated MarR family transcriptional regulator
MNESDYRVIQLLEKKPESTQRIISRELGYSLGKVNYIIATLIDKGIVKLQKFMKSNNKFGYRYILTPSGIKARYRITKDFLKRKMREYERIVKEIDEAKKVLKGEHR